MKTRAAIMGTVLVILVGAAGCGLSTPAPDPYRPDTLKELQQARAKVAGPYQADFTLEFSDREAGGSPSMNWSGTLKSTGKAWTVSSELMKKRAQLAHLDIVQTGDMRYLMQSGTISTHEPSSEQWWGVKGADLGNYFWRTTTRPFEATEARLPEVDPLVYLELDLAHKIEKSALPDGGHRYSLPAEYDGKGVREQVEKLGAGSYGPPLTVDLNRDGVPARVQVRYETTRQFFDVVLTMTLHDIGVKIDEVKPIPSEKVVIGTPTIVIDARGQ